MNLTEFLILSIGIYRLSVLLAYEPGPFSIVERFRNWAGVIVSESGEQSGSSEFSKGLICPFCNSLWLGLLVSVAFYINPGITFIFTLPFAISGVTIITESTING